MIDKMKKSIKEINKNHDIQQQLMNKINYKLVKKIKSKIILQKELIHINKNVFMLIIIKILLIFLFLIIKTIQIIQYKQSEQINLNIIIEKPIKYLSPLNQYKMRIFINSQDQSGLNKTTRLTITNCNDTTQLIRLISKQLNINKNAFIFLLKNQIVNLRILDGWPLTIYNIKNGSHILIKQNLLNTKKSSSTQSTACLQKIQQNSQDLSQQLSNISIQSPYSIQSPRKQSFYTNKQQQNYQSYFQKQLQKMLGYVRQNRLDQIAFLLKQQPDIQDQNLRQKIFIRKNKYILNQIGQCGRSALHWAIHNQNVQMVTFLLMKFADPTVLSIDQYTPLQLAVVHRNIQLVKILINQPKVDPNRVTAQGSALHLAVYHNCIPLINLLLDHGASIDTVDNNNKKAQQLSQMKQIQLIFEDHQKKLKLRFIKPNITKGTILKISSMTWRGKERTLMINPFKNDFTIFKDANVIDFKIKINMINSVQKITQKSWLMDSKTYYFKISYIVQGSEDKLIFGVKHIQILTRWLQSIQLARVYVTNQKYVTKIQPQMQLIQLLDDSKNQIKVHKRQVQNKKNQSPSKKKYSIIDMKVSQDKQQQLSPPKVNKLPNKSFQYPEVHFQAAQEELQKSFNSQNNEGNQLRQSQILLGSILMQKNFDSYTSSTISSRNTVSSVFFGKQNNLSPQQDNFSQTQKPSNFRKKSFDLIQISQFKPIQVQKVSFINFDFIKLLGSGAFGQVYLAKNRKSQKVFALKVLSKKKLMAKKQLKYAVSETNILKRIQHPFIVCLYYSFQTPSNLYLAIDYCPHGDLSQILCQKQKFTEMTARFIIAQVILAIQYVHKQKIIYRDLKPQNILLGKDGYIKLTDFGLSKQNHFAMSFCGSPAYLSPQMLDKKGHSFPTDIYGIGCILYEMVVGEPPYYDQKMDQMFDNIRNARLKFPGYLTKQIRNLISRMLQRDVSKRIGNGGMKQIKQHEFFNGFLWQKLSKKQMDVPKQVFPQSIENDYFKLQNNNQVLNYVDQDYTDNSMLNKIKGFSFVRVEKGF